MMVASRVYELQEAATILCQLADFVERSGLSAGEIGALLADAYRQSPAPLGLDAQQDLRTLTRSATSAADFAGGLRKEAELLLQKANPVAVAG